MSDKTKNRSNFKIISIDKITKPELKQKDIIIESDDDLNSSQKAIDTSESPETDSKFEAQCELLIDKLTVTYKQQREEIRRLIKLHRSEMKHMRKSGKSSVKKDPTGFTKEEVVPDKLAEFLSLPKGSLSSRTLLTKQVYNEIKKRKLYYQNDGRVLRADADIMKLFNLSDSVNQSTDPKDKHGFNFYNLQKHIAKCYNDENNVKVK